MVSLNIGCGNDLWGDIRVDLLRSQTGITNNPNLVASALWLPVRNVAFQEIRCFHVIEHIIDWKGVLAEIVRVSGPSVCVQLRFPIDDGFKRDFLINWSRFEVGNMIHSYLTRRNRAHVWIINPEVVALYLREAGFFVRIRRNKRKFFPNWLSYGRKGKIIGKLYSGFPGLDYEWELEATRT
jgi:hypothetical protein